MPELPEVETVCRGLSAHITGRTIVRATARRRDLRVPLPHDFERSLADRKITAVTRRAKYILIHLDDGKIFIVHLGMSGSLILHDAPLPNFRKHDHVIIEFSPYKLMVFHDPRRFGLIALAAGKDIEGNKLFVQLGKEPLDPETTAERLYDILQHSRAPVKSVIMDQRKIVGVGNIYACEALFRARIHPARPANKITKKETARLMNGIKTVLEEAIRSGGSTLRDYVRSSGDAGYFQHHFSVYGRAKTPCTLCRTPLSTTRQNGRSTFFCQTCQK